MIQFTTILAVDDQHAEELAVAWSTWVRHKPEIMANPLHVYFDYDYGGCHYWINRLSFINHPDRSIFGWSNDHAEDNPYATQREKMLNAFFYAPTEVKTPHFLKLDTDVIATSHGDWISDDLFFGDPAYVSSPWRYSRPADVLDRLNRWAESQSWLAGCRRPVGRKHPDGAKVMHDRIISWLYFGRTDWHREMYEKCGGRLPVPSHDTTLWYLADVLEQRRHTVRFNRRGWQHCGGNLQKMKQLAAVAMKT